MTPGLLQPLDIPSRCWDSVSMDFITQLPQSTQGNTQICVFVDRFSKMVHLVPLPTDATAMVVAQAYIQHVFKLHGIAMSIVSDRGSVFTSQFWRAVHSGLGTKLSMSSSYHPQSDGQTERMNQVLENMLRTWVNSRQDNWENLLPCAEFAMNNSYSSSVSTTPFRVVTGQDPNTPLSIEINSHNPSATVFVKDLTSRIAEAAACLANSQQKMTLATNRHRRSQTFSVGDQVLLKTKNFHFRGNVTRKFMPKYAGPFTVIAPVGEQAYRLELPASMPIHPVFHTELLSPWRSDGRHQPPPPPVEVDGEWEYTVEDIVSHREKPWGRKDTSRNRPVRYDYLVKWTGYGAEHNTWEPQEALSDCKALDEYWKNPKAVRS